MNMKWFKRYALPAVLAAIVPITAQAQTPTPTYTAGDLTVTGEDTNYEFGVVLDPEGKVASTPGTKTIGAWNVDGGSVFGGIAGTAAGNGQSYKLGNVDVTSSKNAAGSAGAMFITDKSGYFDIGTISVTGNQSATTAGIEMDGVLMYNVDDFTGTFKSGDITVKGNTSDGITYNGGDSFGFAVYSGQTSAPGWGAISGSVNIGNIKVDAKQGTGVVAGEIRAGADVQIKGITLNTSGYAMGVEIANHNFQEGNDGTVVDGTLHIEKMAVTSTGGDAVGMRTDGGIDAKSNTMIDDLTVKAASGIAYGVLAENDNDGGDAVPQNIGNMTLGLVNVSGGGAVAVKADDITGLTLTKNIIATKTGLVESAGIIANKNAVVNVIDNVVISADEGFATGGNTTVNVAAGKKLTSSFYAGEDLNLGGAGTVKATAIGVEGDFNANGGYLEIDETNLRDISVGGTFNNNTFFEVTNVGPTSSADAVAQAIEDSGLTIKNGKGAIYAGGKEIFFGADGSVTAGNVKTAPVSGGYVTAMRMAPTYTTWNAVSSQFISSAAFAGNGYRGQECDPCDPVGCDPCDPCDSTNGFVQSLARTAWVNYVARSNEFEDGSVFGDWKYSAEGVQTGTDLYRTKRGQIGMLFGYESGRLRNLTAVSRLESENMYVGLYGSRIFRNGWDVRGSFSYGWQDYDMSRFGDRGGVLDTYSASFDGHTSETTVEIGKRLHWRGNWSLRPVIAVDVFTNNTKAAQETAAGSGLDMYSYAENNLTQAFIRTGAELNWQRKRFGFNGGLFYSYDMHGEALATTVSGGTMGVTNATLSGSELGRELLSYNAGVNFAVAKNLDIYGGYRGETLLDGDGDGVTNTGYVGAAFRW